MNDDKVTEGNMWILQCNHHIKELSEEGENIIQVLYVKTEHNLADLMTKGVSKETLRALMPYLCGHKPIKELMLHIEEAAREALKGAKSEALSGVVPGPSLVTNSCHDSSCSSRLGAKATAADAIERGCSADKLRWFAPIVAATVTSHNNSTGTTPKNAIVTATTIMQTTTNKHNNNKKTRPKTRPTKLTLTKRERFVSHKNNNDYQCSN